MSDFTKEELETMRNGLFSAMGSSSLWRTAENNLLVDKLQSLIDNYCELPCFYYCKHCEEKSVLDEFECPQCYYQGVDEP